MQKLLAIIFGVGLLWAAPAMAQPISVDAITAENGFFSPSISPDGSTILIIRRTAERDDLVRIDWRTRQSAILLSAHERVGERLAWAEWKSNSRLVVSVNAIIRETVVGRTGTRLERTEQNEYQVSRVLAMNADGSDRALMFEGQQRRLAHTLASTTLINMLPNDPNNIQLAAYSASGFSLWQADVNTGRARQLEEGDWETTGWASDINGAPVMRVRRMPNNAGRVYQRRAGREWVTAFEMRGADVNLPDFEFQGVGPDPNTVWVGVRENRDRAGLFLYNTATGEMGAPLFENARADLSYVIREPNTNRLLGACANVDRIECQYFDASLGRHFRAVSQFFENSAEVSLLGMSSDQNVWLLSVDSPSIAPTYYIYDRAGTRVELLVAQTIVTAAQLSPTQTFAYRSRDGVDLWGYLTVPRNAPAAGAPMIVLPHGGPESRDYYGYDELVQFLASRGYVVFQPQFRGSAGFSREFQMAGRRQWGQRMQNDVTDGVQALIASGRVDGARVCIVGGSYGGYAALAGAAFTPELYRCAVSIAGISDLDQALRSERSEAGRRSISFEYWQNSIGHIDNDRAMIQQYSPSLSAENIRVPVLLIHGEEDGIVPIVQSEVMERALRAARKNVRFVRVPESGHSFYAWDAEHRRTFYRELDTFLTANLPPG